jgi:MFS family permease
MTFLVLALYWSVEYEISTLLFYVLVVELNWHLAEHHKRKGAVLSVLHSGTLTALASLWLTQEALYFMGTVLMIWLVSGGVKVKTILQWLLAWFMVMAPLTYFVADEEMKSQSYSNAPLSWWALLMGLSIIAIFEWVQSYLKANQTNKSRAIVAGIFVAGGGSLGWWLGSYFGTAICILGLSYHVANGLRYFKRDRLSEALFLLVLTFVLISYYDVIPW